LISETPPTPVERGISNEFAASEVDEDELSEVDIAAEIEEAVLFCHLTAADATFAALEKDRVDEFPLASGP
jgi:hypothetical protein